tara:strand:+ start:341 stop:532 length:192 start_codon:yes stop_codon:yes gene_type:complete
VIKLEDLPEVIEEMVKDLKTGYHCDESRLIMKIDGIQVQIKVTDDEGDFIDGCGKETTVVMDL